ncbi:MAG TPA: hypothetical protein VGM88_34120 [Kofleriaceae bacterium]|jgi:hypothetical protein
MRLAWLVVMLVGCGNSAPVNGSGGGGGDDGVGSDAGAHGDAAADVAAVPDGALCIGSYLQVCVAHTPTNDLHTADLGLDGGGIWTGDGVTAPNPICRFLHDPNDNHDPCVIIGRDITLDGLGIAFGGRHPVVIAAFGDLTVAAGTTVVVENFRSTIPPGEDDAECVIPAPPASHIGGAGGSFGGAGGPGGGGTEQEATVATLPPALRGGCSGQMGRDDSVAGPGGGAIDLVAAHGIAIQGVVGAPGIGGSGGYGNNVLGTHEGGGGGGSGGLIVLDGATISVTGTLAANGGGGGAGGITYLDAHGYAAPGNAGDLSNEAAHSGDGVGGAGSTIADGQAGTSFTDSVAGGGGGGGAGWIHATVPVTGDGIVSPALR